MYDEKASTCKIVQILIFSDFLSPVERFVPLTSELRYGPRPGTSQCEPLNPGQPR